MHMSALNTEGIHKTVLIQFFEEKKTAIDIKALLLSLRH